jgi:hypothetical protein
MNVHDVAHLDAGRITLSTLRRVQSHNACGKMHVTSNLRKSINVNTTRECTYQRVYPCIVQCATTSNPQRHKTTTYEATEDAACVHRCACCTRILLGICGTTSKSLVRFEIGGAQTCVSNSHNSRPGFRGAYASCRVHTFIAACITICILTCITCRHHTLHVSIDVHVARECYLESVVQR